MDIWPCIPRTSRALSCLLPLLRRLPLPGIHSHVFPRNSLGGVRLQRLCQTQAWGAGEGGHGVQLLQRASMHAFSQPGMCSFVFPTNTYCTPGRLLGAGDPDVSKARRPWERAAQRSRRRLSKSLQV